MKPSRFFLPLLAAGLVVPLVQPLAARQITFEIVATFDYPGSIQTVATGINNAGVVTGTFATAPNLDRSGFVRYPDGSFSAPINDPNDYQLSTELVGINNTGTTAGWFENNTLNNTGLLVTGDTYTEFDVPGATNTYILGVNDAGNFCGSSNDPANGASGFIDIGGVLTSFNIDPRSGTTVTGINNLNQTVGWFASRNLYYGFFRDTDGSLIYPIRPPGGSASLFGLNDRKWMVGNSGDSTGVHAIFFLTPTQWVKFDYPGAIATTFSAINNRGLISGYYTTNTSSGHGFIAQMYLH